MPNYVDMCVYSVVLMRKLLIFFWNMGQTTGGSPDGKRLPPPMETCNTRELEYVEAFGIISINRLIPIDIIKIKVSKMQY